jgi:hypothetical protein
MGITIRPANLEQDRDLMVATLSRYLTPTSNQDRFDWLYRQNPHGATRAWLAFDSDNGEVAGASAAFARRMIVNGDERAGWVLGDFCVAEKYRSLGPALQLQRATLQAVKEAGEAELCYDFPSRRLAAIYQRLGVSPAAHMVRLAKPVRLEQKFEQLFTAKSVAKPASLLGNAVLHVADNRLRDRKSWEIAVHQGDCGDEFTIFEKSIFANSLAHRNGTRRNGSDVGIRAVEVRAVEIRAVEVQRSAKYLNWRYLRHPLVRHQILTARHAGELKGYLVFSCPDESAEIAEWRVGGDMRLLAALVGELAHILRKTGTMTLNAYLLDKDPRLPCLKKMGFWPRESNPMMVYCPSSPSIFSSEWRLMYGDRDS